MAGPAASAKAWITPRVRSGSSGASGPGGIAPADRSHRPVGLIRRPPWTPSAVGLRWVPSGGRFGSGSARPDSPPHRPRTGGARGDSRDVGPGPRVSLLTSQTSVGDRRRRFRSLGACLWRPAEPASLDGVGIGRCRRPRPLRIRCRRRLARLPTGEALGAFHATAAAAGWYAVLVEPRRAGHCEGPNPTATQPSQARAPT